MDAGDISGLIILVVLLALSAFFSSAETALTTVNKIRMRTLSESGDKRADMVIRVTDNSAKMLSAILIGNNVVNLSASSLATSLAIHLFGSMGAGIATGVLTLLVLIFGEVSPKTMAAANAENLSLKIAGTINLLMTLFTPFILIVNLLSKGFMLLIGFHPDENSDNITEEELRTIVDVSQENGVIEDQERDIIHNVFDFGDADAKSVMVPRVDMIFIPEDITYDHLMAIYRKERFTRYPVYKDTTNTVIGIINIKDVFLLSNPKNFNLKSLLRPPVFTYEHKNTYDLFMEMRKSRSTVVIVLDEYGATAGMISMEDLLEEIVGEIRDEYDADEVDDITDLGNRCYRIEASANLEDVCQELNLNFKSEEYDSVGGFCLELLDHIPQEGEEIETDDHVKITIEKMDQNRIEKILLQLPPETVKEEEGKKEKE